MLFSKLSAGRESVAQPVVHSTQYDGFTTTLRFLMGAALLFCVESFLLLTIDGESRLLLGADGIEYRLLAQNVLEHASFSNQTGPPYEASVFRTPGYPALVALSELLPGDSFVWLRALQLGLVAVSAAVAYRIGVLLAGRRVGQIACILLLTYMPLLWLTRYHLSEVLASTLVLVLILMLVRISCQRFPPARRVLLGLGVIFGLTILVRPNHAGLLLLIVPALLYILRSKGASGWNSLDSIATFLVAVMVVITPWTVRNFVVSTEIVPLGATSGISLYTSANQYAGQISHQMNEQDWARFLPDSRRVAATSATDRQSLAEREIAADQAWRSAASDLVAQTGLGGMAATMPRRLAYQWAVADYPPTASYSTFHRLAQMQHYVLFVLVVAGALEGLSK